MGSWHADFSDELGCLAAFEKERCAADAHRTHGAVLPCSPITCPCSGRSARKMFDNDVSKLLRVPMRPNLQRLSTGVLSVEEHLVIVNDKYGEMDASTGPNVLENIQAWLMDAKACPTTWPTLLRIRRENPHF